jgi:TPR repeat protein
MALLDQDEQEAYEALDHDSIRECNRLAAHAWDGESNTANSSGVAWKDLDGAKAVVACKAALKSDPRNSRLMYQLARAYDKLGDARAYELMQTAAQDYGNPAALYHYGTFHENGEYTKKDVQKAFTSYAEGGGQGHIPSLYARGRLLYKHAQSNSERQMALEDIRWAANRNYSSAVKFLEQLN